jgi:copper chaperone CopZ
MKNQKKPNNKSGLMHISSSAKMYLLYLILPFLLLLLFKTLHAGSMNFPADEKTSISVPSIVCGKCVKNVTKALKNVDGVIKVKVDLDSKIATVTYDTEKTSVPDLENAITAAGYDANNKTADPKAYEKLDDCCKIR